MRPDGTWYTGTSLHPPATEENAAALQRSRRAGLRGVFLDDDFRLAQSPGMIGGCFCEEHRSRFLKSYGHAPERWPELLDAVSRRALTPLLRDWIAFTCDDLTGSFRAQQRAAPRVRLGNMVMFMGAEKAGIRLADYHDVPFRVGELMFDDASFGSVKAKTQEVFSALFHRRYARADLAFSETTAFPADRLSAANMAAKLAVSTVADVRNTMFMSGVTPFPRSHWQTLGPAMKKHAAIHARLAGHTPRGPFKHYWGERGRCASDDNAWSLFLAAGVPFEVTGEPSTEGWTFLGDHDADGAADGALHASGTTIIYRPEAGVRIEGGREMPETLAALFELKHAIADRLASVPHVEQDVPVVCAWYPTARAVLLWNLGEKREPVTLRLGSTRREIDLTALDVALVEDIASE
jgi:hypothetical protein